MNRNLKSRMFGIVMSFMLMVTLFSVGTGNVSAATKLTSFNFKLQADAWGGANLDAEWNPTGAGIQADYIIVTLETDGGDNFDLRLVATTDYVSKRVIVKSLTGLKAKGKSYTYYYIPQNGTCPTTADKCVRVPIVAHASDADHAALADSLFGIEIYNGSLFGGTLTVTGTFTYMNY